MLASTYAVEIAGRRILAEASIAPMYDPKNPFVPARDADVDRTASNDREME